LNTKFSEFINTFFVSAESNYFATFHANKEHQEKLESLDFIQRILFKKRSFDNDMNNLYFLDYIENYIDFIKFAKTEEKLISYSRN